MFAARSLRLLPALFVGMLLALGCGESDPDSDPQGEGAAGASSDAGGSAGVSAGGAGVSSSAGAGGEGGVGGEAPPPPPPPTCDDNAHVGDYCGGTTSKWPRKSRARWLFGGPFKAGSANHRG